MSKKIIYYDDELNDDFANNNIKRKPLGNNFKYVHTGFLWRAFEFVLYYVIASPLVYLIQKIYTKQRFANRKAFKKVEKEGYFIYSNHTHIMNDAYVGAMSVWPKKCFVIANPDATSIVGIRAIVQALGVIPLGSSITETKEMLDCIGTRINEGNAIMIYPEAHIWPYYTKIRPFPNTSFYYPAKFNKPIFVLTNCYQKCKIGKRPKVITYVDGPFYPDTKLHPRAAAEKLRSVAYDTMVRRSEEYSTFEYIKYVKKPDIPSEEAATASDLSCD